MQQRLTYHLSSEQVVRPPVGGAAADATRYLPRLDLVRFAMLLLRRSWLIGLCGIMVGGATWAVLSRMPKTYEAHGSVYVSTRAPAVLDIQAVAPEESRDLEQMRSVEHGISSSGLLLRVMDREGLASAPDFAEPGMSRQDALGLLADRLKVELRRGTRIIDLRVEDTNPQRAKRLVEGLVEEYEKWTTERQQALTRSVSEGLREEEESLRLRMEKSAAALQQFRQKHPVAGLEARKGAGVTPDELATLSDNLTRAKSERLRHEAQMEAFRRLRADDPEAVAGLSQGERTTEVLGLVRAVQAKEVEFERLKERYLEKHPAYIETSNELSRLRENLAAGLRSAAEAMEKDLRVAAENERKLEAEVEKARANAVENEGFRAEFEALSRVAAADREIHESVAKRLRETTLAASVPASILRWHDMPLEPEHPVKPRKAILAGFAGALGLVGGFLLVIGLELGNGRVRDAAAAARAAQVPVLASLPAGHGVADLVMLAEPDGAVAEGIRCLRAALTPPAGAKRTQTILFTAAEAGEGSSFCAMNFAAALALQGYRTLLVDADLRSAGLSRGHLSGFGGEICGLAEYLDGSGDPAKACHPTPLAGLYLMSSGSIRPDAAELLSRTRFPVLLEEAERWFDRIVIDTPAVLSVSDALAVARYADRSCLVAGHRQAKQRDLRKAADLLRGCGAQLVGVVWNTPPAKVGARPGGSPVMPVLQRKLAAGQEVTADPAGLATSPAPPG